MNRETYLVNASKWKARQEVMSKRDRGLSWRQIAARLAFRRPESNRYMKAQTALQGLGV